MVHFKDRVQAGRLLAEALKKYADDPQAVVLGLPRGGVVPAFEVAQLLHLPLDVIIVRKIGAPFEPELALGALTEDGNILFNRDVMAMLGLVRHDVQDIVDEKLKEAEQRRVLFRAGNKPLDLSGKTAIIIDDGVATGATLRVAVTAAKKRGAERIVVALPIAPAGFKSEIEPEADEVIVLHESEVFPGVSYFYDNFLQVEDQDVVHLLHQIHLKKGR